MHSFHVTQYNTRYKLGVQHFTKSILQWVHKQNNCQLYEWHNSWCEKLGHLLNSVFSTQFSLWYFLVIFLLSQIAFWYHHTCINFASVTATEFSKSWHWWCWWWCCWPKIISYYLKWRWYCIVTTILPT